MRPMALAPADHATPTILVVDDDRKTLHFVSALLVNAGWRVVTAESGLEGLAEARRLSPAAIVLDLMLPGMNGDDVLRRLRAGDRTRHIPVIVLTGVPEWLQSHRDLTPEFDDVLLKPVSEQRLVDAVRDAVTRSAAMEPKESL